MAAFLGIWAMSISQQNIAKPIFRVVSLQLTIAICFASLVGAMSDVHRGWSAAYGGAVAVIGSAVYALLVAKGSDDAKQALRIHVRAEMAKIFVTVLLFALALTLFQSAAWLWLILGFVMATFAYWFSLLAV
jgi:ATP synthase protein I